MQDINMSLPTTTITIQQAPADAVVLDRLSCHHASDPLLPNRLPM